MHIYAYFSKLLVKYNEFALVKIVNLDKIFVMCMSDVDT